MIPLYSSTMAREDAQYYENIHFCTVPNVQNL